MTTAQDVYDHVLTNKIFKLRDTHKGDWCDATRLNGREFMLGNTIAEVNEALKTLFLAEVATTLKQKPALVTQLFNTTIAFCITDERKEPVLAVHKNSIGKLQITKRYEKILRPHMLEPSDVTLEVAVREAGYGGHVANLKRAEILQHMDAEKDYREFGTWSKFIYLTKCGQEKLPEILENLNIKKRRINTGISPSHRGQPLGPSR